MTREKIVTMTDKELIKQEIENLKAKVDDESSYSNGWKQALRAIEIFINSLPEESASEDFEEAYDNYYDETWDEHGGIAMVVNNCHDIWFPSQATSDFFKAGAEWQKQKSMQDFLEKSCEWLKDQACYYSHWEYNGDTYEKEIVVDTDNLIEDFKNYMKNEM